MVDDPAMDGSSANGPGTTGAVVAAWLLVVWIGGPPSPCESVSCRDKLGDIKYVLESKQGMMVTDCF